MYSNFFEKMYANIGEKIKTLAMGVFLIGSLVSVFAGISLLITTEKTIFLLMLICGPIFSWISSWLIYGFGEIINTLKQIETKDKQDNQTKISEAKRTTEKRTEHIAEKESSCPIQKTAPPKLQTDNAVAETKPQIKVTEQVGEKLPATAKTISFDSHHEITESPTTTAPLQPPTITPERETKKRELSEAQKKARLKLEAKKRAEEEARNHAKIMEQIKNGIPITAKANRFDEITCPACAKTIDATNKSGLQKCPNF